MSLTFQTEFPAVPESQIISDFDDGFVLDAITDREAICTPTQVKILSGTPRRRGGVIEIERQYEGAADGIEFSGAHLWYQQRIFSERSFTPFKMREGTSVTFRWKLLWV